MQNNSSVKLSIVIPAYNEESRLPSTLDSIFEYFEGKPYTLEVIVVNDGSSDHTSEVVRNNSHYGSQLGLIAFDENHGKGYAVKKGLLQAQGELVMYDDADGASPIEEFHKLIHAIDDGFDIAIGSRAIEKELVEDLWYRRLLGTVFNALIKLIVINDFQDTQCGFKLFKRHCAQEIFNKVCLNGFSFDVEVLFLAKKLGYKIAEIPILWHSVPGSKINIFIDSPLMLLAVMKIRLRDLMGKYKT
jgi:dolichyl-phosphate beta-glucosyltransferase